MASLNKVLLIGNLTKDPDIRYTSSGAAVTDLRLAVSRVYTTKSGEKKEEVCFVSIVVWGKQAESCGTYLKKGSPVFVEGRLQLDSWETPEGEKRSRIRVQAERVQFLSRGGFSKDKEESGAGEGQHAEVAGGSIPTGPAEVELGSIGDDDIPF